MSGAIKLSQDMAKLINNRQGSDIQFKVGGDVTSIVRHNGKASYDESATLYAHSCILRCRSRYFAAMLDEEKNWKESSKGVIYKPNISPSTFKDVLHYIYTGNIPAKTSGNIVELIAAADEMDLEELSIGCQNELMRTVKCIFLGEGDSGKNEGTGERVEGSTKHRVSIDVAIRTQIIPALNLANTHSLSYLSQKLLDIMLPNMPVVIDSPDAYSSLINNISSETLTKIIASDKLAMMERSVWDLALDWACHQKNLSKAAVEALLTNPDGDNEEDGDEAVINDTHLDELKATLEPILPAIRFSLLDPEDYAHMTDILGYFLPRIRYSQLNRHFITGDRTRQLDMPRVESVEREVSSKIVVKYMSWEFLRKTIFETGGIADRPSSCKDLKFDLLYRASEHDFKAETFHQLCDYKGPTLTLVRSSDGHLCGGVNFAHWKSDNSSSSNLLNFLIALPDGYHRKNTLIFKSSSSARSTSNRINYGPSFTSDLTIANSSNTNQDSYSCLPRSYNGKGASHTALAGSSYFMVSDYEVFAISKK